MNRTKECLDRGWKFLPEDPKAPQAVGHQAIYMASKTERGRGLAARDYYDADWEDVTLPHDYQILGDYDESLQGSHGYLPRNNAWYRRSFKLDVQDMDKRITLIFDGIATHATIWVNGHLMERNFCGYNAVEIDITDVIRPVDEANVIAVRVEANTEDFEGWWYEGAGIYRHVWLQKTSKTAVATWGTHIRPVKLEDGWTVIIDTEIFNRDFGADILRVHHDIRCASDIKTAASEEHVALCNEGLVINRQELTVNHPILWRLEEPYLYRLVTTLNKGDQVVDTYETYFGFRTLEFHADRGFYLNGVPTKVKGVCGHQDHGALGVAVTEKVWELKIKKLKEMGCNAYRVGHTPAPTEFLDLCDRYGLLVMDESRWFESSRIGRMQMENMLKKDRNHPCVFIWSVGNEEPVQSTEVGARIAGTLKNVVRSYDTSRPVTVALNGGFYDSQISKVSDIVGINYNFSAYDKVREMLPDHPVCSPEVGATSNCRSTYVDDSANGRFVAYDEVAAPFGSVHRKAWEEVNKREFVFGMFVWAGYEYRGESTWPKLFAGGGALDSSGYEKDNYHLFRALWTDKPMVHVMPHWNLGFKEGEMVKVMTYSNCSSVELFLNGRSLGCRENDPVWQLEWQVPYEPGSLKALAYKDNRLVAEDERRTLKGPFHVAIEQYESGSASKDETTLIFDVSIRDADGVLAAHIDEDMAFDIEGMTLLGVGNGDPADHERNRSYSKRLFRGLCQVICRANAGYKRARISVMTPFYGEATLEVATDNLRSYKMVPVVPREWKVTQWWKSPLKSEEVNLDSGVNTGDVNTWEPVVLSKNTFDDSQGNRHYYVNTKMPSFDDGSKTAALKVKGIVGALQIRVEHNPDYWPHPEPVKLLKVDKIYSDKTLQDVIDLKGFKKDEAIFMHIVTSPNTEEPASLESLEWLIE